MSSKSTGQPTAEDFRAVLRQRFAEETAAGNERVDVDAGSLHRQVGGYPARDGNHRMRTCCTVMMSEKQERDRLMVIPPSGWGASLTIRYRLPRGE